MSEKFHCYACPNFCVYLGSDFVKIRLTLDLNSALDLIDRGRDFFREYWDHSLVFQDPINFLESFIMYSCSKCLVHPFRWIDGLSDCMLLSFCHSWGNLKFFSLSFLGFFGLIVSCIWLCKDEFCSKAEFSCEYWHLSYLSH